MGFLIFSILLALIAIISLLYAIFTSSSDDKRGGFITCAIATIVCVVVLIAGTAIVVPTGHVAVMTRFSRVTGQVFENGLNWKSLIDSPHMMSVQTQLYPDDGLTAASKDLQDVTIALAINYRLDPRQAPTLYRTVGMQYINIIAHPAILEAVKEITAQYNAADMILRRPDVKNDITQSLTNRLGEYGIRIETVNIKNFSFSEEFSKAIEAKVVAVQAVQEAENKLLQVEVEARQAKQKAEGEAAANIAIAEGKATSIGIVTEAQVKANNAIQESLTEDILRYIFIDRVGQNVDVWIVPDSQALTISK